MRVPMLLAASMLTLATARPAYAIQAWESQIATALGRTGTEMPGGVYRVGLPRSDLKVNLDGIPIKPSFALGGWVAFAQHGSGNQVMLMGDLVLTDDEVNPVMKRLLEGGVEVTALHNHLLKASPHTMYMHVGGHGDAAVLARTLQAALALTKLPAPAAPASPAAASPALPINVAAVEAALGRPGKVNNGVLAFSIPRAQPPREGGMAIPDAMGTAIAINFQPTNGGRAAITGDFVLAAAEVVPVLRALRTNGIEVTALHNHMLDEQPRLFFMHFWAENDAVALAKGLRAALDKVATRRP